MHIYSTGQDFTVLFLTSINFQLLKKERENIHALILMAIKNLTKKKEFKTEFKIVMTSKLCSKTDLYIYLGASIAK